MITNKILIVLLSILAFYILYLLILKKDESPQNDFNFYENFDINNNNIDYTGIINENREKEFQSNVIKGLTLETKFNRPYQKKQIYNTYFDNLRKNKPLSITYEDPLFSDVITYENDIVNNKIGLEQCLENCNGSCIEYGQTGIAHCFPNNNGKILGSSYYENLRDNTFKTEDYSEKPQQLKFPNLR